MLLYYFICITGSIGKQFLIQTYDNKIGNDYDDYNDTPGPPGCNPKRTYFNQEVSCKKGV